MILKNIWRNLLLMILSDIAYANNFENAAIRSYEMEPKEDENINAITGTAGLEDLNGNAMKQQQVAKENIYYLNGLTMVSGTVVKRLELKSLLNCQNQELKSSRVPYGSYLLLQNIIRGELSRNVGCADTITVTTHGEFKFVKYLLPLVERWRAPISVALFAPGHDIFAVMAAIRYVRNCRPESALIRQYVSFHIYFPRAHLPPYIPADEEDILTWTYSCTDDASEIYHQSSSDIYRTAHNLSYPINVGRNIARFAANTHFILGLDIELLPTPGLAQQFLELVWCDPSVYFERGLRQRVYPLPIFELQANASIPKDKIDLIRMLKTRDAIRFHERICTECHWIPQQRQWEKARNTELGVFTVALREYKYKFWEPFYISDNHEPVFDERFKWEGGYNKRIQAYAMCLLNYEYHVLHPAFLVHSPGIKIKSKISNPMIKVSVKQRILSEYGRLFGNNSFCKV